jgi:hypothetical protein
MHFRVIARRCCPLSGREVVRMGIIFALMDVTIQNAGYITDVINWLIVRLDKTGPPQ